jgi:hypothetical protein
LLRDEWIDPAGLAGPLRAAALRWNAAVAADPRWRGPRWHWRRRWPSLDFAGEEGEDDRTEERRIIAASAALISFERTEWTYSHGATHGYGGTRYGAALVAADRLLRPSDLFADPAGWARETLPRVHALTFGRERAEDLLDASAWRIGWPGLAINLGWVRGHAGGEILLELGWAELAPHLSTSGAGIARGLEQPVPAPARP